MLCGDTLPPTTKRWLLAPVRNRPVAAIISPHAHFSPTTPNKRQRARKPPASAPFPSPQIMDMHRDEDVTAGELYNRAMISKQDLQAEHAGGAAA